MGEIKRRGRVWWIRYYRDGRRFEESAHSEKRADADRLLKVREGDVAKGVPVTSKIGRLRFDEAADDVITDYKVNGKRSLRQLCGRMTRHLLPFFGGRRMSALTTADVRTFIALRQEAGASNGEINRELTALKRAFSLAVQAGKLLAKPYIPMLHEDNVRTEFFEREQFEAVCHRLPAAIQPVIRFAYITGWRITSEVLPLEWRQIDFSGGGEIRLDVGTTKNDEGRIFPMTRALRLVLEEQRRSVDALAQAGVICPWVFHRNGRPIKTFIKAWRQACRGAGTPGKLQHDFRRTAVRNLVRAGVPERVAMQMTGHKTRSVFERYNIVSGGDLQAAARSLDTAGDAGENSWRQKA